MTHEKLTDEERYCLIVGNSHNYLRVPMLAKLLRIHDAERARTEAAEARATVNFQALTKASDRAVAAELTLYGYIKKWADAERDLTAERAETARLRVACDIGTDLRQQLWDRLAAATGLLLRVDDALENEGPWLQSAQDNIVELESDVSLAIERSLEAERQAALHCERAERNYEKMEAAIARIAELEALMQADCDEYREGVRDAQLAEQAANARACAAERMSVAARMALKEDGEMQEKLDKVEADFESTERCLRTALSESGRLGVEKHALESALAAERARVEAAEQDKLSAEAQSNDWKRSLEAERAETARLRASVEKARSVLSGPGPLLHRVREARAFLSAQPAPAHTFCSSCLAVRRGEHNPGCPAQAEPTTLQRIAAALDNPALNLVETCNAVAEIIAEARARGEL